MAGSLTDKLMQVGQVGTTTSLQAPGKALGVSSINVGSVVNWPTATAFVIAIRTVDPALVSDTNPSGMVSGTYTEWVVTNSGTTTVTINPVPVAGNDQVYTAGVNTQVFIPISAYRENKIVEWGLTHGAEDGTLLPAAVQTAIGTNGIVSTNLATNSVTAPKLATNAILLNKLVYTTPQVGFSGTSVTQMTGMTLAVTIPAGGRDVEVSVLIPDMSNTTGATNIWVSIWDGTVGSGTQLQEVVTTPAGSAFRSSLYAYAILSAPAAGAKTFNIGWRVQANSVSTNLSATVPAIIKATAV